MLFIWMAREREEADLNLPRLPSLDRHKHRSWLDRSRLLILHRLLRRFLGQFDLRRHRFLKQKVRGL